MTGRYSSNTGLPTAFMPGSVVGLPNEMPTMPQLLRQAGYSAHMIGKWHLGSAQQKQASLFWQYFSTMYILSLCVLCTNQYILLNIPTPQIRVQPAKVFNHTLGTSLGQWTSTTKHCHKVLWIGSVHLKMERMNTELNQGMRL